MQTDDEESEPEPEAVRRRLFPEEPASEYGTPEPEEHHLEIPTPEPANPIEALESKWGIVEPRISAVQALQIACNNLDAAEAFDPLRIEAAARGCWAEFANSVQWYATAFEEGQEVDITRDELTRRFERLKSVIRLSKEALLKFVATEGNDREEPLEKVGTRTEIISAWYDRASLLGLRALEAEGCEHLCYSEIKSEGYKTRAFKAETTIQQALFDTCDSLAHEILYNKLTSNGSFQNDIPAHIAANRHDPRFPVIQKDRHVFAFKNGLYVAWLRQSILNPDCGVTVADGEIRDAFLTYSSGQVDRLLRPEVCACKYFDIPFDDAAREQVTTGAAEWYGLATPNLQQILDAQRLPEEACRWIYAFIGRMLYSVGELDGLQLIVYLKGIAGTGKQTDICIDGIVSFRGASCLLQSRCAC